MHSASKREATISAAKLHLREYFSHTARMELEVPTKSAHHQTDQSRCRSICAQFVVETAAQKTRRYTNFREIDRTGRPRILEA